MREILFRGQTRRYGEKVRLNGEKIKSNWVYGGIFPQKVECDFPFYGRWQYYAFSGVDHSGGIFRLFLRL